MLLMGEDYAVNPTPCAGRIVRMERLQRKIADFFGWALAVNGGVLVLNLFLMFSLGLISLSWGRAFYLWTNRWHVSEAGLVLSLVAGLVFVARTPANAETWRYWMHAAMRYALAYVFLDYGFSKVFKGQFTTSLSTLDMPLGEISGFALAWRFFGYSYVYVLFLAASEIVGGLLLFSRRTTLLATAILLPVTINVAVVNYTHGIGVLAEAILLLLMTAYLFLLDFQRLKALFWDHAAVAPRAFPRFWDGRLLRSARYGAIAFIVLFTLAENVALYVEYERATTPLHGTWRVDAYRVNGRPRPDAWQRLYIDSDRFLSIRTASPKVREYESDVTLAARNQPIRLVDVDTNSLYLDGSYELRGPGRMLIRGRQGADGIEVALSKVR